MIFLDMIRHDIKKICSLWTPQNILKKVSIMFSSLWAYNFHHVLESVSGFISSVCLCAKFEAHTSTDASERTPQVEVIYMLSLKLCAGNIWCRHKKVYMRNSSAIGSLSSTQGSPCLCPYPLLSSILSSHSHLLSAMVAIKFSVLSCISHTIYWKILSFNFHSLPVNHELNQMRLL